MLKLLKRLRKDESGATAIEYGLIAALISVAVIGGGTMIGNNLKTTFSNVGDSLATATGDMDELAGGEGGDD